MGAWMKKAVVIELAIVLSIILLGAAFVIATSSSPSTGGEWNASSVNATPYMYVGSGGMLYLFDSGESGTMIYALDGSGAVAWTYVVPRPWSAINYWDRRLEVPEVVEQHIFANPGDQRPVFAEAGGDMYLYLRNPVVSMQPGAVYEKVIAIHEGHVAWEMPLYPDSSVPWMYRDVWIKEQGGRLYVFSSYNLSVVATDGTFLFNIPGVSDPPALDAEGNIYLSEVRQGPPISAYYNYPGMPVASYIGMPSGTIASYDCDRTLQWRVDSDVQPVRQAIDRMSAPDGCDLPLYSDGRFYVPFMHGITALDINGKVLWTANIDDNVSLLPVMPFGPGGYVFMVRDNSRWYEANQTPVSYAIGPDGTVSIVEPAGGGMDLLTAALGTGYYGDRWQDDEIQADITALSPVNITAVDLRRGGALWTLTVPPANVSTVVANEANVLRLFEYSQRAYGSIDYTNNHRDLLDNPTLMFAVLGSTQVSVLASGENIYVSYYSCNYEQPMGYWTGTTYTRLFSDVRISSNPVLIGRSRICYASGVAALDRNGTILWNRAMDSILAGMAACNGTVYFGGRGGGLSAIRTEVALGITVTAVLYLFFRFFLVGTVARARSRINDNANRNNVLEQVRRQPGSTMYDLSRRLGMNSGTVRYHLFILSLNHRVTTFRDGKYVRYFGNSDALGAAEREIISLLRREWARSMLTTLLHNGSMSNVELSRALGVTEPAVSGYLRELTTKGIVVREMAPGGSVSYSVQSDYREKILDAFERVPVPVEL